MQSWDEVINNKPQTKLKATEDCKRNIKDCVFTDLFSKPKYQVELYKALKLSDNSIYRNSEEYNKVLNTTEEDITDVTIHNTITNALYNDIGMKVGNKYLILVEAQSTWSWNIVIRALYYYVETCRELFTKDGNSVYNEKKLDIPEPELYVIYTGDKHKDIKEISLAKDFFNKSEDDYKFLDVKIKVIHTGNNMDIVNQYIEFSKRLDINRKVYDFNTAVERTINSCVDDNILTEYLSEKGKELYTMLSDLFDDEVIQRAYLKEVTEDAKKEGELKATIELLHELGIPQEQIVDKLIEKFKFDRESALGLISKYNFSKVID